MHVLVQTVQGLKPFAQKHAIFSYYKLIDLSTLYILYIYNSIIQICINS